MRLLVERGAEVNSRDMWSWTPLHLASRFGHLKVVKLLLEHGAHVHALDGDGQTPFLSIVTEGDCRFTPGSWRVKSKVRQIRVLLPVVEPYPLERTKLGRFQGRVLTCNCLVCRVGF